MANKEFQLQHPSGLRISRDLSEESFLDSLAGRNAIITDMQTGWVWYRLPEFHDDDVIVGIALGFNSGRLIDVSLSNCDPKYGAGWNEWSVEKEKLRAESIGNWLASKGYPIGTHDWGGVWAGFDAKGGFGSATVRYTV